MSSRPTDPSQRAPRDAAQTPAPPAEPDPTGVREILASLRDPGPMPADLIGRITASLSAEQARREQLLGTDGTAGAPGAASPTVHSFGAAQQRRASAARRWPLVAAAASVAVLAGALVLGILGVLNGGTITTASHDAASLTSAEGGAESGMSTESNPEAGASAAQENDDDAAGETDDGAAGDTAEAQGDAAVMAAAVPVLSTGAVLSRANLAQHVRTLVEREERVPDARSEGLAADSPVNSVHGAADCLGIALNESSAALAERIDAIDFVRYDGEPAGLILVRDQPGGSSGPVTAYLVPADCGRSTPHLLDDPLPLAS